MPQRIPDALRQILAEDFPGEDLGTILARVFQNGAWTAFYPDGSRRVYPDSVFEVQIQPPGETVWYEIDVNTEPQTWRDLTTEPPTKIEIAVYAGNFRNGARGKEDKVWAESDFTLDDVQTQRGHKRRGHGGSKK